ncbi:MAG TPA: methyltetrahydrofolate cobalamin methyltransferase [Armatimonadota bacterium]|nr:methyltetrahydrofolate cobalamin methyltransferase [Armatimonadota bacterium]
MLIVGERINTSRKVKGEPIIENAVRARDAEYFIDLARKQVEAGASYIDVNAGTLLEGEPDAIEWLVTTIQGAMDIPCAIDSPNPVAIERALKVHKGQAMINSITAEKVRYKNVLPLVKEYDTKVIALSMGDEGIPGDAEGRISVARELIGNLIEAGISLDNIYADPLVFPIANGGEYGIAVLDTIRTVKAEFPGIHASAGVSNVSHGMPARKFLNQAFTVMCMTAGLDAAIVDPMDKQLMALIYATEALLGRDEFCAEYLSASREGKFEAPA